MVAKLFQLQVRPNGDLLPLADLSPAALLQEQTGGWRKCIQTASAELDALKHRDQEDK